MSTGGSTNGATAVLDVTGVRKTYTAYQRFKRPPVAPTPSSSARCSGSWLTAAAGPGRLTVRTQPATILRSE